MKLYCSVLLAVSVLLAGCGPGGAKLVPVTGKVMVKGKPAEGAVVMLHPSKAEMATASGVADAEGAFKLMSAGEPGVLAGKYQVTITWPDASKKPTQAQIMMGTAEPGPDLLKGKYGTKTATTLTAEVTSSTTALPTFDLP